MSASDSSAVEVGLDVLLRRDDAARWRTLSGARVGLLCHDASVSLSLVHAAEALAQAGVNVAFLLGPEHGLRGVAQDMVGVSERTDALLGVPVHSLYGDDAASLSPDPALLADIDVLLVDLQDVGSRYYTYVWTLVLCMEACARAGVSVWVLDRPNPLGGVVVEGPGIDDGYHSFVGLHSVPVRHGMTISELARLAAAERGIDVDLRVVPMRGWQPERLWEATGRAFVAPSPNMPTLTTALLYPGGCLWEGTNLSEGRGTTRPFELVGAPWVDGHALAARLAADGLPGVTARPTWFQPMFQKHAGELCGAVQLHVTDGAALSPLRTGIAVLLASSGLWPESFAFRERPYEFVTDRLAIDLLAGGPWLRRAIDERASLDEACAGFAAAEAAFRERRAPHLLYPRHDAPGRAAPR